MPDIINNNLKSFYELQFYNTPIINGWKFEFLIHGFPNFFSI